MFCGLRGEPNTLHRRRLLPDRDTLLAFEGCQDVFGNAVIKICAAEERIAVRRQNGHAVSFDAQNRDVKGATTKIVYQNRFMKPATQSVRHGCGDGFAQYSLNVEAGSARRGWLANSDTIADARLLSCIRQRLARLRLNRRLVGSVSMSVILQPTPTDNALGKLRPGAVDLPLSGLGPLLDEHVGDAPEVTPELRRRRRSNPVGARLP